MRNTAKHSYEFMKRLLSNININFLILLAALTFLFWLPTSTLPYWWDSAGFIMQSSHHYLLSNFSSPANSFSDFAHPPLLSLLIAASWKIFGQSLLVSHLVYLPFVLLCVIATFLVGKELVKGKAEGSLVGFLAAMLLLFTPVFLAQVGIIYIEIPSTALAVTSYFFYLKKRYAFYAISASMMVLMRESTIIIVFLFILIFLHELYKSKKKIRTLYQEKKNILLQFLPLIVLSAWFVFHRVSTGWWFVAPGRVVGDPNIFSVNILQVVSVFTFLFLSQWRFLLFAVFMSCFFGSYFYSEKIWKRQKAFWSVRKLPLILIPVIFLLFFGKTEFLSRYIIIALPFFYLASLLTLTSALRSQNQKISAVGLVLFSLICGYVFSTEWDTHRRIRTYYYPPLEENLEYLDILSLGQQVSAYMEATHPSQNTYSSFPMNYMLTMPYQGFVKKPVRVRECRSYKSGEKIDVIIYHLFSPGSQYCYQLLERKKPLSIKRFTKNGKGIIVAAYRK